jgi:Fimbrial assembly protein (PilN)
MAKTPTWGQRPGGPPRIDLLPRQLVEQRVLRRQRTGVGAGFLVLLALLGLWYVLESRQLGRTQDQADQERAVATGLRDQRAKLQPLATLESQIAAADQLKASVYKQEIRFSGVMRDISAIVPDDVWLTSMSVSFKEAGNGSATPATSSSTNASGGTAAATVTPGSPGAGSPVASITFAGSGLGHVDVGGFLRALARGPEKDGQQLYLNPYFTSSTKAAAGGQQTVTFSATVDLSSAAYSGRFQPAGSGTVTP